MAYDAGGRCTPTKAMDESHARLAGWLQAAKDGGFELHTIRPGGYPKAVRIGDRDRPFQIELEPGEEVPAFRDGLVAERHNRG